MNPTQNIAFVRNHHSPVQDEQYIRAKIYNEQVTILFQQFQLTFIAIILIAPLFVVYLNDKSNTQSVIAWLICFWVISLARYYHCHRFFNKQPESIDYPKWEKHFLLGTALSGLLWGSVAFWFFPENNPPHQVFLFFILAGLSGGSISMSQRPIAFRLFVLPMLIPYVIKLLSLGGQANLTMAALFLLFIVMMILISSRVCETISESLRLRFEKEELRDQYKQLQNHIEQTNINLLSALKHNEVKELALLENETFLSSILNTASDGIITSDHQGIILSANHAIERDFGYKEQELIGKSINIIMLENIRLKHDNYMKNYIKTNGPSMVGRMIEVQGRKKDGAALPIEITVSEARINDKMFFTGIIRDITKRKFAETKLHNTMRELQQAKQDLESVNSQLQNSNAELLEQSQHDALTNLANRRYLLKTMNHEWFRCQRNKKPLSIILLDIDYFKRYNDHYGHQAGDECLIKISQTLEKQLSRSSDFIARYGGEEFIVVLPETDLEGANYLAEKMRIAVSSLGIPHLQSTVTDHVTISGGAASMVPVQDCNCELLISAADRALYLAKKSNRNNIQKAD